MSPIRILHFSDRLSERGGADRHLLGTLEHQARIHDVHLAVGRDDGTAVAPCPVTLVPALDAPGRGPVSLDEIQGSLRPDVIHVHNVMNPVALSWAADRGAVMTVQDHRAFCPGRGKWTADGRVCRDSMAPEVCAGCFEDEEYFLDITARTTDRLLQIRRLRIVVLSRYMERELVAVGVPANRIRVLPPFVHGLDRDATPSGPPCVLFVGRLVEAKGVHDAIAAWRRSGVSLPLVLAGTGPLRRHLAESGYEVLGWVSRPELSGLYRRAAVVVMPSRWQEPFGIVGLEALTLGTPVAAWESGGVAEWHPGPGLVPWGDVEALARAIREAIGRTETPPRGFDPETRMAELEKWYLSESKDR